MKTIVIEELEEIELKSRLLKAIGKMKKSLEKFEIKMLKNEIKVLQNLARKNNRNKINTIIKEAKKAAKHYIANTEVSREDARIKHRNLSEK